MSRLNELIERYENQTIEEMLYGNTYAEQILELPGGREYFDRKREEAEEEHKKTMEKFKEIAENIAMSF